MIYGVYAIKDAKTSFMPCNVDYNDASAIRNFEHAVMAPDSLMRSHPADYTLYRLGSYNTETGLIVSEADPQQIADAASVVRK
ncbi:VP5 [Gokushovirus WZ-2015a]|nr:VP5 [Gokushovirus WZ-2015a]